MHHCPHLLFVYRRVPFCLTVPYNVQCATRADCYVFVRVIRNDICEQMSFFENDIICVLPGEGKTQAAHDTHEGCRGPQEGGGE